MENRKYSIVTTVYNDEKKISFLLGDIEQQELLPYEVIIVDGGSNDTTVKIVKEYAIKSKINIKIFEGERLNIAQGFNKGIQNVKTDYIGIVACGNHYPSNYFKILFEELCRQKAYVAYGSLKGTEGSEFEQAYNMINFGKYNLYVPEFPNNHGNLAHKNMYVEYGLFYEKFRYAGEDSHYFIKGISKQMPICCAKEAVVTWEVPDNIESYKKQINVYTVGDMEMFENYSFFKIYRKRILYVAMYVFVVFALLVPINVINMVGIICVLILGLFNIQLLVRKGYIYFKLKQLSYFHAVITILCNLHLFQRKNKISDIIKKSRLRGSFMSWWIKVFCGCR